MRECSECGMDFANDELTRFRGEAVCFSCHNILSYDNDDDEDDEDTDNEEEKEPVDFDDDDDEDEDEDDDSEGYSE